MHLLLALFLTLTLTFALALPSRNPPCTYRGLSPYWHDTVVRQYINLWGGDFSLLNKTMDPSVTEYMDRVPVGATSILFSISDSATILEFIRESRAPFTRYSFVEIVHFGQDNLVVLRWRLDAVFGGNARAMLPAGSPVSYNGTDILTLDRCTGLIKEVQSSQDYVTLFHVLGIPMPSS